MNALDTLIISAMLFFIVRGVWRGFFREVGSLAGIVLGIWLANRFQPMMTSILRPLMPSFQLLPLVSFAVIFLLILLTCNLAGRGLKAVLKMALLGWVDRGLGAGLAFLKGTILTYLVIVLLTFFLPAKYPLIARSSLAPVIVSSYQSLAGFVSKGAYTRWKEKWLGRQEKGRNISPKRSQKAY